MSQRIVGGLGRVFAGGHAVLVKIGRKHTEIPVIQIAGLIGCFAVQCLHHVHCGKIGGKKQIKGKVNELTAQKELDLPLRRPGKSLHCAGPVRAGLTAGFTLNK